jgi:hypothetical protein
LRLNHACGGDSLHRTRGDTKETEE